MNSNAWRPMVLSGAIRTSWSLPHSSLPGAEHAARAGRGATPATRAREERRSHLVAFRATRSRQAISPQAPLWRRRIPMRAAADLRKAVAIVSYSLLLIRRGIGRERSARPASRNLLRHLAGKFVRPRRLAGFTHWRRRFRIWVAWRDSRRRLGRRARRCRRDFGRFDRHLHRHLAIFAEIGSSALPTAYQREMAAIVHGFAARHAIEGTPAHAGAKVASWRLRGIKCAAAIHTRGGRDRFEGNGGTPTASREGWVRSRPGAPRRRR